MDNLLAALSVLILQETEKLRDGDETVDEWQSNILRLLAIYLAASLMAGLDADTLTTEQEALVAQALQEQSGFLAGFAEDLAQGWQDKFMARAESYANAIVPLYWRGATWPLHLPAEPKDGSSECLMNCGCEWVINWYDREQGNADAYWYRGKQDSCPTCLEREKEWSPLHFEQGEPTNLTEAMA